MHRKYTIYAGQKQKEMSFFMLKTALHHNNIINNVYLCTKTQVRINPNYTHEKNFVPVRSHYANISSVVLAVPKIMLTFALRNKQSIDNMGTKKTTFPERTREEILAWLSAARERKAAWERETEMELKALAEETNRAKASHYYDFAL